MDTNNPPLEGGKVFDPGPLLEMSKVSPAVRTTLLGLIGNVVDRAPIQLRDARQAWDLGQGEEAARVLHTMRGTVGTLGATRFAAATRELESALHAGNRGVVAELFDAAERELAATVAAAKALLVQETGTATGSEHAAGERQGVPVANEPVAGDPVAQSPVAEGSVRDWYESIRGDMRNILDDIRQLKDEVQDQGRDLLFEQAVAQLPACIVVEDDDLIAHVLVHLLKREGYRVQRYADGRAALQAIQQATEPPGLILLDVMLPYVDGFELIREIREQRRWTKVPIIMLTAKQQENDIVRALDAGATDYVVKPFQPNELMARLRRILREKG